MNDLREVEIYLEILKKEFKLFTQSDIAAFLGVHQTTIASWIQRNSVKTLRKYIKNKGLDVEEIDKKAEGLDSAQKEKFFLACTKYKITLEDIAQQTNISVEKLNTFKDDETTTQIFENYDDVLAKCFYEKYNELMRSQVRTTEVKRTQFAELYFVNIHFSKPLFWLVYICIGFYVAEGKIKPEEVENFLDILIENRQNFGSEISSIQSTEELIDTVLIKIEELLPKTDRNEVEEFVSQFSKP